MFNGVPEQQFHQFIASRTAALPLPLPLTLPVHVSPLPPTFSIHELHQPPPHPHPQLFQPHLFQPLPRQPSPNEVEQKEQEEDEKRVIGVELDMEGTRSVSEVMDPWLKEEVLALLTVRSTMGNDFSDFIWGHVSRKLSELGYKRSAEKCKEKFEEVSKYCNNTSYGNFYRSFNELEALFQGQNHNKSMDDQMVRTNEEEKTAAGVNVEENSANETLENPLEETQQVLKRPKRKKRKKQHKLEMMKDFSEFVHNVLVQQEDLQKKFVEDIQRQEEERVAREEVWRRQETDRLNKELELRAREQAIACERQLMIIELLKKLSSISPSQTQGNKEDPKTCTNHPKSNNPNVPSSSTIDIPPINQVPLPTQDNPQKPNSSPLNPSSQSPTQTNTDFTNSANQLLALANHNVTSSEKEDHGKRWPRDEVNSLINLRCNLQNTTEDTKAPLWERISQGMLELGYKRSAKKCKEKWENINKYFRKTKDANKKRSLDSKTCPYFHQLNNLYNQGRLIAPSDVPENLPNSPKNQLDTLESGTGGGGGSSSSQAGFSEAATQVHVGEDDFSDEHMIRTRVAEVGIHKDPPLFENHIPTCRHLQTFMLN